MKQNGRSSIATKVILASIIVFVVAAAIFLYRKNTVYVSDSHSIESRFDEPILAIYDRSPVTRGKLSTSITHISIVLDKFATPILFKNLANLLSNKGGIMISVKLSGKADLLTEVNSGAFDKAFKLFFETLKQHNPPVLVRLNPEMEVPVKIYPWQYQSSRAYVDAFRHFARLARVYAPKVSIVWGPAGYPGTEEYYPGDDFTDVVSITLGSEAEKQLNAYPPYPSFEIEVKRKLHRLRFMDKPVLVLGQNKMKIDSSIAKDIERGLAQIRAEGSIIYSTAKYEKVNKIPERKGSPEVGVYDPKLLLTSSPAVDVEHIFIDLTHVQNGAFERDFNAIIGRKHSPIVSFEPWRDQKMRGDTNVLLNTINGVYDEEFRELYRIMKSAGHTVYLRFAHEMEIPIHRYAWQSQDPVLYIKAFRYFMEFGGHNSNIKRIWGPAGDRGSLEWWPGSDVVDFISIAIYGLPDKNITDPKMQESFSTIYDRKFHRVSLVGKPIFITEFGVKGPEDYKQQWMEEAADLIRKHKEIVGVSYFNLADNPKAWGDIPAPDWSIKPATFEKFVKKLSDQ